MKTKKEKRAKQATLLLARTGSTALLDRVSSSAGLNRAAVIVAAQQKFGHLCDELMETTESWRMWELLWGIYNDYRVSPDREDQLVASVVKAFIDKRQPR